MSIDDNNLEQYKIVLLGESGVGKTSIINRYINRRFDDDLTPTQGASFANKILKFDEFNGKSIKLNIWDTAGQERYRALSKIFYQDANAAILVYDITDKKSFEEIKMYWVNQIKEHSPENINKYIYF